MWGNFALWNKTRSFWDINNSISHERGSEQSERASEGVSAAEGTSKASSPEQANEWVVRANEQTDERMAQYLCLGSCLFQTTVGRCGLRRRKATFPCSSHLSPVWIPALVFSSALPLFVPRFLSYFPCKHLPSPSVLPLFLSWFLPWFFPPLCLYLFLDSCCVSFLYTCPFLHSCLFSCLDSCLGSFLHNAFISALFPHRIPPSIPLLPSLLPIFFHSSQPGFLPPLCLYLCLDTCRISFLNTCLLHSCLHSYLGFRFDPDLDSCLCSFLRTAFICALILVAIPLSIFAFTFTPAFIFVWNPIMIVSLIPFWFNP